MSSINDMGRFSASQQAHGGSNRDETIFQKTIAESQELREALGKKRWVFKRRTHMPFKLRVCTFALILAFLLVVYCISFATGAQWGADINNICDNIMVMFSNWIFSILGGIAGKDWSDKAIPLQRLLTLGPTAYVLMASVLSLCVTGGIASWWSYVATRHALDDGTSNFRAEESNVAQNQNAAVDEFAQFSTEEEVRAYAVSKYLSQGMNRAQAESMSQVDVAKFRNSRNMPEPVIPMVSPVQDDLDFLGANANVPLG